MATLKRPLLLTGVVLAAGVVGLVAARLIIPSVSPPPDNLGIRGEQLAPCPASPNCVSSFATDAEHAIDPIPYTVSLEQAKSTLLQILDERPRTTVVANLPDYVYAEARTLVFGFIDDNEFYFDDANKVIHVRAAARLGRDDLGVNRQRIEAIRQSFAAAVNQ